MRRTFTPRPAAVEGPVEDADSGRSSRWGSDAEQSYRNRLGIEPKEVGKKCWRQRYGSGVWIGVGFFAAGSLAFMLLGVASSERNRHHFVTSFIIP